jgi:predicted transcriptional regulator
MKVKELIEKANLKVFSGEKGLNNDISGGYTSDLLSDVMGHAEAGNVWITLQTHKNTMAIASLKELAAIVLVKGFQPEEDTFLQSNEENIPILGTEAETFEISGIIYNLIKS